MTEQTDERWARLSAMANELINAPPSVVAKEQEDDGNFIKMIEAALAGLEATKPRVGRGTLIVELGLKRADIRDHPERYQANSPHVAPTRSPCMEGVANMGSGGERSTGGIEVGRKPSTSRASSRDDPPRPAPSVNLTNVHTKKQFNEAIQQAEEDEDDKPW